MTTDEAILTSNGFASGVLGLHPYDWQARALLPMEDAMRGIPQQLAVVAPNGSGKDGIIIPSLAYYWLFYNPRGRVIITSKSDLQLSTQTIPSLDRHWRKFGWSEPVRSPRYTLITPKGGILHAFVTNEGVRIEGAHSRPGEPLMVIVNEAKSVDMDIYQGLDRCTIDMLVLISSPGLRNGRFYEACTKLADRYTVIRAGLADCPHIPQSHIDDVIAKWGPNHPFTRSTLHGEFMSQEDGIQFTNTIEEVESCIVFPPQWKPGFQYGFFDFAEGRAENVLVIRNGNKYEVADAWREVNEDAVVGRAIFLVNKYNLKNGQWGADAAAKSILDKMAQAGFVGNRQNFGQTLPNSPYKSWVAAAWREFADKIKNREVIIPDDPVLKDQGTSRKKIISPLGKLAVEDKAVMLRDRGVESPDRWDALVGAAAAHDDSMEVHENVIDLTQWKLNDQSARRIAKCVGSY